MTDAPWSVRRSRFKASARRSVLDAARLLQMKAGLGPLPRNVSTSLFALPQLLEMAMDVRAEKTAPILCPSIYGTSQDAVAISPSSFGEIVEIDFERLAVVGGPRRVRGATGPLSKSEVIP